MTRQLIATAGPLVGQRFSLGERTIIGRADGADVQILAEGISRQHAAIIENDDGELYLMDLASKNGTFVEEKPIFRMLLTPGAKFRISTHEFMLDDDAATLDGEGPVDKTHRRGRQRKGGSST